MAGKDNTKTVVDRLRMMAKQVASGAIKPTGSAEHDHWGEPGGAGGFTWSFDAQHDVIRYEAISRKVSAQLKDLADKIESGEFEAREELHNDMIEETTGGWTARVEERPIGFTYTVILTRK